MIVSTYQPLFSPFPAFFYKAHLSDVMVILDDVQFPLRTTWINRNRFKNDQGTLWITIPVWKKGLGLQQINQVRICYEGNWRRKHLASLKTSYANSPYFGQHLDVVEKMLSGKFEKLVDLNLMIIQYLKKHLRIDTPLILQSALGISAKGNHLLIEICRKTHASTYLAQNAARKYLSARLFADAGIELNFFRPPSPIYPQLWGDFIHDLSAFDLLFNCGPKSHEILCGSLNHPC
ncbi:MAG: WbqC family protein [Deltaproteobacteria bacterium]|nr:WbqC family protein [Deltaproteobacteria bacterium]MBW2018885.1 WbqC family protein [Deltaproteobacteria bacterium]MBW2073640.1 WbqC family protein [Deltaproteobacteria bacterium]